MQKSARFLALVSVLSFAVVPSLHAEQLGTNPHPQAVSAVRATWDSFIYNVRIYFGM